MNAYKVEFRQLLDGKFELYRSEYYTSKAKALTALTIQIYGVEKTLE